MLVIFDCDGVLVDSEPISNRLLAEHLTEIGLPMTTEESVELFMGRHWSDTQAIIESRLGRPLPEGFREERRRRIREVAERELVCIEGVPGVLASLPGPRCVASSSSHLWISWALERCGLLGFFEHRFSAEDVGRGKPWPDLFLHAAASMGFAPGECVVVEDSPAGIEAARRAGMRVVGYRADDADVVISSMAELPGVLNGSH